MTLISVKVWVIIMRLLPSAIAMEAEVGDVPTEQPEPMDRIGLLVGERRAISAQNEKGRPFRVGLVASSPKAL